MNANSQSMQCLQAKLREAGYSRPFVRSLLPDWWDDAIAKTPAGFQQASLLLGRLLGVKPETLWTEDAQAALVTPDGCKFKQRADTQSHELDIACALALSAARLVLKGFRPAYQGGLPSDASTIRHVLLPGKPWIGFQDLLGYCLAQGIPVIFLDHFPPKAKKMAGVSFEHQARPVIVLTQRRPHGFMLFDLAHELGHVALGHTQGGAWVVDAEIDENAQDDEEQAANQFARELLAGNADFNKVPAGRLFPQQLKAMAERIGAQEQIDPLHVALNYGHVNKAHWSSAIGAAKLIAEGRPTDQAILKQTLLAALDPDAMPEDDLAALWRLMGEADA